ncbi:MAG: hypothetical protein AAF152_04150 [Cyanobacteria bacterium P01_A01_bin.114]
MTAHSLRLLLSTLIDYAGLFPPAALDFKPAIAAYKTYCADAHRWMLGRFVLPLSQLSQLEDQLDRQYSAAFWPLSVVLDPSTQALEALTYWQGKQDRFTIAALEFKPCSAAAIAALLPQLPPHVSVFFEVPIDPTLPDYLPDYLAVLKGTRAAAKVRIGGPTQADFPSVEALAHFIGACARAEIPFKATAGLHHPLRSCQALPNGRWVNMHGFLNVALAATFAYGYQVSSTEIASILQIDTPSALDFSDYGITCQIPLNSKFSEIINMAGQVTLDVLSHVRSRYFQGIGACSFQNPLAELDRLGFLDSTFTKSAVPYALST